MYGGEGVPKCVIFDVRSIFDVQFLSENFSIYMVMVGLHAREPHEQPSLNLINSTILRATLTIFRGSKVLPKAFYAIGLCA